jgi:hypothetical protein
MIETIVFAEVATMRRMEHVCKMCPNAKTMKFLTKLPINATVLQALFEIIIMFAFPPVLLMKYGMANSVCAMLAMLDMEHARNAQPTQYLMLTKMHAFAV